MDFRYFIHSSGATIHAGRSRDYITVDDASTIFKEYIEMRKLIDIPEEIVQPLKILAVKADKDLKNYIQDILSEHVRVGSKK